MIDTAGLVLEHMVLIASYRNRVFFASALIASCCKHYSKTEQIKVQCQLHQLLWCVAKILLPALFLAGNFNCKSNENS